VRGIPFRNHILLNNEIYKMTYLAIWKDPLGEAYRMKYRAQIIDNISLYVVNLVSPIFICLIRKCPEY
jgi:hypothetical protein